MEVFEIHITADETILEKAKPLELKTIVIDLLKPDKTYLRTEYMTSHVQKFENYQKCLQHVLNEIVPKLSNVVRVKIETPYYSHYAADSIYIESHFEAKDSLYPISKNKNKESLLATDREYKFHNYESFRKKYKDFVVELCLFDTNVKEDLDWFNLYKGIK